MRYLSYLLIGLFFAAGSAKAQTQPTHQTTAAASEYKASMDGWLVNLNEAMALSAKTGKPIFANFTGSDWCIWCHRLRDEVFKTEAFKTWAQENVILLEVDFPRKFRLPEDAAAQNQSMAQAFQVRGYPTVWVFFMTYDAEKNNNVITPLAQTGYVAGGATAFLNDLNSKITQSQKEQGQQ